MQRSDGNSTPGIATDEENGLLGEAPESPSPPHAPRAGRRLAVFALVLAVGFGTALYFGLRHQQAARAELATAIQESARQPVAVTHPQPNTTQLSVTFPANIQGFIETPIYARTNGYIKRWLADIGAHVKAGQLLAEIETPELDQQLRQAEAAEGQAQANLNLARITAERYQGLLKYDGVSKQEVDQANGTLQADEANLKAAIATVDQLKEMQSFEKVSAPFSGVITGRAIDVGSLIQAGTNTLLFKLAQTSTLRVYANVPETFGPDMAPGVQADVAVAAFPGRKFTGKVVRTSGGIDPATRTLLTEVDVPNPKDLLAPGEYGEVTFRLRSAQPTMVIPANTLLFRAQGTQVALVEGGDKVRLQSIQLGRDFGNSLEVLSGLKPEDWIIVNPSDSIEDGALVEVEPSTGPPPATASH